MVSFVLDIAFLRLTQFSQLNVSALLSFSASLIPLLFLIISPLSLSVNMYEASDGTGCCSHDSIISVFPMDYIIVNLLQKLEADEVKMIF